jgi:hypothetical protein
MSNTRTRRAELIAAVGLPVAAILIYLIAVAMRWANGL